MNVKTTLFAVLLLLCGSCKDAQKAKPMEPESNSVAMETAVSSTYEDLAGNSIELADYKGKRVLVNYWATWCRPCIEEMPDLLKLQDILTAENYVFLLASDESVKKIEKFKEARGFDFNFIKYNGGYAELDINALPVTFIYNEAGERVLRFDGAMEWSTPELIDQLKNLD
jgi:thiol-disulfide isomerase/thioredoxin